MERCKITTYDVKAGPVKEKTRELTPEEEAQPHRVKARQLAEENPGKVACGWQLTGTPHDTADAKLLEDM